MVKIGILKIKLLHPLKHPLMHLACLSRCEFAQSDKAALLDKLRRTSSGLPTYQAKPRLSRLSCQGLSRERRTVCWKHTCDTRFPHTFLTPSSYTILHATID